jgi:peptidoglycan/LPS O-acetylase OafA/YrhL
MLEWPVCQRSRFVTSGLKTNAAENPAVKGKTILSVQVMRGLAAVAVAIYHTHLILAQPEYGSIETFGAVASRGWMGVNFFFVLSGFIIMFAHVNDVGRPDRIGNYLWKRLVRVYPVYWIFLTFFLIAAYRGIGHASFSWRPENLISAYALVKIAEPLSLPLQVAWTLFYEMAFYVVFCTLILNRLLGTVVFAAWAASILIGSLALGHEPGMLHMWDDMWCAYFLIGACTYFVFTRADARWGVPLLVLGLLLLVLTAATLAGGRIGITQKNPLVLLALAAPFALILLGGALSERHHNWRFSRPLLKIGDATYSIYLVHSPVITVFALLNLRLAAHWMPPIPLFVLTATVAVTAGVLAHIFVEKPVLRALRDLRAGRRAVGQAAE